MSLIEIALLVALALIAMGFFWLRRTHAKLAESLRVSEARQEAGDAQRHSALAQDLRKLQAHMEAAEARQERRNLEQLHSALAGVVQDFHQRLQTQFEGQLDALAKLARSSEQLLRKQRNEQMEAMHHARRLADRMDGAAQEFGKLVAENTELLALAGQVRETLSLLGARQDALDGDILRQAQSVDAMGAAVKDLRAGFEQAAENLLQQTRRSLDAMTQRQAQGNSALQKELNDSLGKAIAGMNKQLSVMAPMTQQAKLQTFR